MGLQELMNKYGHKPKMENWVKLKEADDKEYTELSFRISGLFLTGTIEILILRR